MRVEPVELALAVAIVSKLEFLTARLVSLGA